MNMNFKRKLPIPQEIKQMYPITEEDSEIRNRNVNEIKDIIAGRSNKFLLIIGPCSADRQDAVIEYLKKLSEINKKVNDVLCIVPRIYTNKPRTTGMGYKGMLHQPDPLRDPDILEGLIAIRKIHMTALKEFGFSAADEMLYPENHRYLSDLLGYVAVGARSVENQQHRLTTSGLDLPVGMKNPTSGDFHILINSLKAAQKPHTFIYRNWEVESKGNPYAHAILRGYVDKSAKAHNNYHLKELNKMIELYEETDLANKAIIVDCNHDNSNKDYLKQIEIAKVILKYRKENPKIKQYVKGLMIESYLLDGNQSIDEHVYGKSITDPCLGWEKSERLILEIADILRKEK